MLKYYVFSFALLSQKVFLLKHAKFLHEPSENCTEMLYQASIELLSVIFQVEIQFCTNNSRETGLHVHEVPFLRQGRNIAQIHDIFPCKTKTVVKIAKKYFHDLKS